MDKNKFEKICEKIAFGIVLGIIILGFIIFNINNTAFGQIILNDIIPNYKMDENITAMFEKDESIQAMADSENINEEVYNGEVLEETEVIGIEDIHYEEVEKNTSNNVKNFSDEIDINKLNDLDYLRQKFYVVDAKTALSKDYFNVNDFLKADLKIEKSDEPKVLIFHTHSQEMFKDSKPNDINEGIVGAGTRLAQILEEKYGIKSLHITDERFDVVNGKTERNGAYERMEPVITKILAENPSIELVIDLHRDGVDESLHLVENINGKPTAKIMFFNGISRILQGGQLKNISNLENPYVKQNLALSFNMQKVAMEKFPGFTRKIYIKPYRYSLHMKAKSMLVEAGAQNNTKEEIYNAMELLAEIINDVVFE